MLLNACHRVPSQFTSRKINALIVPNAPFVLSRLRDLDSGNGGPEISAKHLYGRRVLNAVVVTPTTELGDEVRGAAPMERTDDTAIAHESGNWTAQVFERPQCVTRRQRLDEVAPFA